MADGVTHAVYTVFRLWYMYLLYACVALNSLFVTVTPSIIMHNVCVVNLVSFYAFFLFGMNDPEFGFNVTIVDKYYYEYEYI